MASDLILPCLISSRRWWRFQVSQRRSSWRLATTLEWFATVQTSVRASRPAPTNPDNERSSFLLPTLSALNFLFAVCMSGRQITRRSSSYDTTVRNSFTFSFIYAPYILLAFIMWTTPIFLINFIKCPRWGYTDTAKTRSIKKKLPCHYET